MSHVLAEQNEEAPAGHQPEPAGQQPEPAGQQPEPAGQQPEPAVHQPEPAGHQPEPAGHQPEPAVHQPEPAGHQPALAQHQHELEPHSDALATTILVLAGSGGVGKTYLGQQLAQVPNIIESDGGPDRQIAQLVAALEANPPPELVVLTLVRDVDQVGAAITTATGIVPVLGVLIKDLDNAFAASLTTTTNYASWHVLRRTHGVPGSWRLVAGTADPDAGAWLSRVKLDK